MAKVQGTGGVLFRARDPKALAEWYRDHLGVSLVPDLPACTTPKGNPIELWQPAGRDGTSQS